MSRKIFTEICLTFILFYTKYKIYNISIIYITMFILAYILYYAISMPKINKKMAYLLLYSKFHAKIVVIITITIKYIKLLNNYYYLV